MKIGFTGTQSCGKTTLVKELAKLPEFKNYQTLTERSKYLMELGIPLNTDSTIKGQTIFLAERASELMRENIITDRTIIDVMAFAKCSKSISNIDSEDFCQYASKMLKDYDYIFYVSSEGVEIENNGIRETDSVYRDEIDNKIKELLKTYNKQIKDLHYIKGSVGERINQVKQVVFS